MWGLSIPFWEVVFRWATISAFVLGGFTATAAFVSAWVGYELTDIIQKDADKRISEAKTEAARANEASERLRNDTARLQADNLALQTVLLPRHAGVIGVDGPPMAQTWFAGLEAFSGTLLAIQVVSGDPEAQNLANEIAIAVHSFGWNPQLIDGKRSNAPSANIPEGVRVSYPAGKPWTPQEPVQPWFAWHKATEALADALTRAGLAIGDRPVSRFGFSNNPPDATDVRFGIQKTYFNPPLEGVYLEVGSRPVEGTLQWIKQGRPDVFGKLPGAANPDSAAPR